MTVLTVNINGKKSEKALKALKAVIEAFDMDYEVKKSNKIEDEAVLVTAAEWADIQKRLNTEQFYDDFSTSIKNIKGSFDGKMKLKNARELLHGH